MSQSALRIVIDLKEIEITAIRAQGAGGQNVNKVSNAVHLRFDIHNSSLSAQIKERLTLLRDHRITADGIVLIKAQEHRSLERNRAQAIERLQALIARVTLPPKIRRPTKPTKSSVKKRLEQKTKHSAEKSARAKGRTGAILRETGY